MLLTLVGRVLQLVDQVDLGLVRACDPSHMYTLYGVQQDALTTLSHINTSKVPKPMSIR